MKKNILLLFLLLAAAGFSCTTDKAASSGEGLLLSTPEAEGISSQAILDFVDGLEAEQTGKIHSFMLRRHGKVVASAWWDPYKPEYPHMLYSLSKSFTSTAIGMAIDEDLLSLDDEVVSFFPDKLPEEVSDHLAAMRIRDLLKMNTGHQDDAVGRMRAKESWVEGYLALEVEHKPGTHFRYNSGATYMLSAILQKVSGETLLEFLQPRLFGPLGIENPSWEMSPEGIHMGGWGLNITTGDISRFGQFLLQEGNWEGKQLVSKEWIREATSFQTSNGSNPESDWEQGYGYQFWMCRQSVFRGDGAFGQFCIVFPEQDAVLAMTSGTDDLQGVLNLVWEHILPALQDEPLAADQEGLASLEQKIEALAIVPPEGEAKSAEVLEGIGGPYTMEPNMLAITGLAFDFGSAESQITITTVEDEQVITAGYGTWNPGDMHIPQWESTQMSASGAWTDEDSYVLRVIHTETPYATTFTFHFEGGRVAMDTELNISFGPTGFPTIKGKLTD